MNNREQFALDVAEYAAGEALARNLTWWEVLLGMSQVIRIIAEARKTDEIQHKT
jgi:hypothetical protein